MKQNSVFIKNGSQFIDLSEDTWFPPEVKKVTVRINGKDRIFSPVESSWDSFFLSDEKVSDDFMNESAILAPDDSKGF